jgi:hypothetical protein
MLLIVEWIAVALFVAAMLALIRELRRIHKRWIELSAVVEDAERETRRRLAKLFRSFRRER